MSKDEVLVRVENVSKKFCRSLKRSLWYGMRDLGNELRGRAHGGDGQLRQDEFWAVDDISFELRRGECLGLIGRNGAGKSSLLKMLNGIMKPDKGRIEMRGRIGALIELGAGFNPVLSGRENIYINGSVLGFSKREIDKKLESIIDFSEIRESIDAPVQSYSSGMKVRLGFAIATMMTPDVLLIDEVLAVGDLGFRMKCFNRLFEVSNSSACILVSHSMADIARVSSHMMLMNRGRLCYFGSDVDAGVRGYLDLFGTEAPSVMGGDKAKLLKITIQPSAGKSAHPIPCIRHRDDLIATLEFHVDAEINKYSIHLGIMDREGRAIAQCFSRDSRIDFTNTHEPVTVRVRVPNIPFSTGIYYVNVNFTENTVDSIRGGYLAHYRAAASFKATNYSSSLQAPVQLTAEWEIVA